VLQEIVYFTIVEAFISICDYRTVGNCSILFFVALGLHKIGVFIKV
jgi:hypothetical protein